MVSEFKREWKHPAKQEPDKKKYNNKKKCKGRTIPFYGHFQWGLLKCDQVVPQKFCKSKWRCQHFLEKKNKSHPLWRAGKENSQSVDNYRSLLEDLCFYVVDHMKNSFWKYAKVTVRRGQKCCSLDRQHQ